MFLELKERKLGIQWVGKRVREFGPRQRLIGSGSGLVLREYGQVLVLWQIRLKVYLCWIKPCSAWAVEVMEEAQV